MRPAASQFIAREGNMSNSTIRALFLATAFALAGCGGGGWHVAYSPPPAAPPPPPPPPPPLIPAATTSQQFVAMGATRPDTGDRSPLFGAADQLQVRYVESSNSYEVKIPGSDEWGGIHASTLNSNYFQGAATLSIPTINTQYSSLVSWTDGATYSGFEAIGIATLAGAVPVTGSASYTGQLWGSTSETHSNSEVTIMGGVELSFDFGLGSLSGRISPSVFNYADYDDYTLAPISLRETIYSSGSTTFSGKFDTDLAGVNFFNGRFTGPHAEELIGDFALPYRSPIDGQPYQADGAFVAGK
jgi:hypothetical protein